MQRRLTGPSTNNTGRSVFGGWINEVQGLTMSSLDARPMQQRGNRMRQSFVQAMQNVALEGHNRVRFPTERDMKLAIQPFDGMEVFLRTWSALHLVGASFLASTVLRTASVGWNLE